MARFIEFSELSQGMVCTAPLFNKKMEVIFPEYHVIEQCYINEWQSSKLDGVWTVGEFISSEKGNKFFLPGYMSLTLRVLIQQYYNDVRAIKQQFTDLKKLDLGRFQQIASFWVSYIVKENDSQILLRVIRYARSQEAYFVVHVLDVMLLSLGVYTKYNPNFNNSLLMKLAIGALLFDIGMLVIPTSNKEVEELTELQKKQINQHPMLGYHFLVQEIKVPKIFALPALEHHERPDGSGYPSGIDYRKIDPNSMIIALADVFTSQIRSRSFKDSKEPAEILKDFLNLVIPKFTHDFTYHISAFISYVAVYPVSSILELSTKDIVIVVKNVSYNLTRPIVQPLLDKDKIPYIVYSEIDLSDENNQHIFITGMFGKKHLSSIKEFDFVSKTHTKKSTVEEKGQEGYAKKSKTHISIPVTQEKTMKFKL